MDGHFRAKMALCLPKAELRSCRKLLRCKITSQKLWPGGSRDHCRIVGRKRHRREGHGQPATVRLCLKAAAKLAIGRHATRYHQAPCSKSLRRSEGLAKEVADDGILKRRNQIEGLSIAKNGRGPRRSTQRRKPLLMSGAEASGMPM